MLTTLLSNIICKTFETKVGRNQSRHTVPQAMLVSFKAYGKDEDHLSERTVYRYVELLIYGPDNYVGVLCREIVVTDGVREEMPWKKLSYHDSCWRSDGVDRFFWAHQHALCTVNDLFEKDWYTVIAPTKEMVDTIRSRSF